MRVYTFVVTAVLAFVSFAMAADRNANVENAALDRPISLGELTPTPEMWFYQQDRKLYDDPKVAVRQKAEFRAAQRQLRLAASRWYGIDNSRPATVNTPFQGMTYGPGFTGSRDPNQWPSSAGNTIVIDSKRGNYNYR